MSTVLIARPKLGTRLTRNAYKFHELKMVSVSASRSRFLHVLKNLDRHFISEPSIMYTQGQRRSIKCISCYDNSVQRNVNTIWWPVRLRPSLYIVL